MREETNPSDLIDPNRNPAAPMEETPDRNLSFIPEATATHTVARFAVESLQFLDPDGTATQDLPAFAQEEAVLLEMYRDLVLNRVFDQKAVNLQRTGQLGTYAASLGQEAIGVAIGWSLRPDDVYVPSYREPASLLRRGITMSSILSYWSGDERSMDCEGANPHDFPVNLSIGAHCTHAVGAAYALKLRGEGQAALCSLGDGATSKGDFYEGLNAAAVWKLPLVYLVTNNHYAISVPISGQTACQTLAQKGIGAGVSTLQVDGNDLIAMRYALETALDYTREGKGTVMIEALSYRLHDHTTADDASRYRSPTEVEQAWENEPLRRFRRHLESQGLWDDEKEAALQETAKQQVDLAVEEYLAVTPANPAELMFDHLYKQLPRGLQSQRAAAEQRKGGDH